MIVGRGLSSHPASSTCTTTTGGLKRDPAAETQVSQGITTLCRADGDSPWPIANTSRPA